MRPGSRTLGSSRCAAPAATRTVSTASKRCWRSGSRGQPSGGVQWATVDAHIILNDTSDELQARFVGPSKEFAALDLAAVIAAVDLEELAV